MKETKEAFIRIGGVTLDYAQSMTVRVALNDFLFTLNDPNSSLGKIGDGYRDRVKELITMIHENMEEQRSHDETETKTIN
jgi:hypothetical protein